VAKTLYRAGWIVAFQDGEHRILRDGCLVVEDDRIVHVGSTYPDPVDRYVDLPDRIVTPGYINTHAHLDESPIDKSVQEDVGNRQFWLTGLIEILPTEMAGLDGDGARACIDYSLIELARTGTTTVLQMGGHADYTADAIEASGLFEDVHVRRHVWARRYTADEYIALLDTFSGHIAMEPPRRAHLYAEIRRRIAARPDARVLRHWFAVLHVTRRRT